MGGATALVGPTRGKNGALPRAGQRRPADSEVLLLCLGPLLPWHECRVEPRDMTVAGYLSIFGQRRTANHVYIAATMDAAMWSAELAPCGVGCAPKPEGPRKPSVSRHARSRMLHPTPPRA